MNEQFFSYLGLREDPFHVSPDPRFYCSTSAHETALVELLFGIETRKGFLVLTGEAGTGKTSLLNRILEWLHRRRRSSAYIFHTHLEPIGLLRFILHDFGVPCDSRSKSVLVNALHTWLRQRHAAGDLPVLVLDEAQALPIHTLDELRLLLNLETPRGKLLQIVLSGQPELDEKLRLPALRQLRQRIMVHAHLPLLTQRETAAYISTRLAVAGCSDSPLFPDEVVRDIYTSSHGIPRVVNLLCEHALMAAYAQRQPIVSPEMVRRIAVDFDLVAEPMTINESEPQARYAGFSRFPSVPSMPAVEERPKPPAPKQHSGVPATGWEQIDFTVLKEGPAAAYKETQLAFEEQLLPDVPPPAPETERYWRRKRSGVRAFAYGCVTATRRGWNDVIDGISDFGIDAQTAFSSFVERFKRPSVATQTAIKKDAVPAIPAAPPLESQQFWRKQQAASLVPRNSAASARHGWDALASPIVRYVRSVSYSFVRDTRSFFEALVPRTPALEMGSSGDDAMEKSSIHRNVIAPVMHWLRQPIAANRTNPRK
jgi:general secretion pathway protein A